MRRPGARPPCPAGELAKSGESSPPVGGTIGGARARTGRRILSGSAQNHFAPYTPLARARSIPGRARPLLPALMATVTPTRQSAPPLRGQQNDRPHTRCEKPQHWRSRRCSAPAPVAGGFRVEMTTRSTERYRVDRSLVERARPPPGSSRR
jgi:hypothetical protein